ncbi:hypothetical protein ACJMK2_023464, partial [Sinanodonta woodiana]
SLPDIIQDCIQDLSSHVQEDYQTASKIVYRTCHLTFKWLTSIQDLSSQVQEAYQTASPIVYRTCHLKFKRLTRQHPRLYTGLVISRSRGLPDSIHDCIQDLSSHVQEAYQTASKIVYRTCRLTF